MERDSRGFGARSFDPVLETTIYRALRRAIFLAVALLLLFRFLEAVTFLVLFFALVLLVAAVLNPVVAWLERRRVPRSVAAAGLGLLLLGVAATAIWFGVSPLIDQLAQLAREAPTLWDELRGRAQRFFASRPELMVQLPTANELVQRLGPMLSGIAGQLGRYTINLATVVVSLVLLVVLVVYTLASPHPLVASLLAAVPERHRPKAERILAAVLARLKAWAIGSLLLGLIVGILTGLGLYLLKVPFALVFALLAAFGELLPNLGPFLSAIPPVLVALAVDPMLALWVAVLFLVVQQLENNLIVPLVMSRTLDLHPLSVTFMVLVMGTLFGVVGAILAVPATVVIKTLYQELYLADRVPNPELLEAQSERLIADGSG
jgi:predicted PurR-regulated permease PerM